MFRQLVEDGADLHIIDGKGNNLLHHAALGGKAEMVGLLVDLGVGT